MEDRSINKVMIFVCIVVAGALLLVFVPPFTLFGFEFKRVDVLATIRVDEVEDQDTIAVVTPVKPQFVDTCKTGVVCIEDFTEKNNALHRFYNALDSENRQVRIAWFGDSFIEGDLLTGAIRELFQEKYGGDGVGFVPVNCITAGFRMTARTYASGWDEFCLTDSIFTRSKQGISGHYFIPYENATAAFASRSLYGTEADTCNLAEIYFVTDGGLKFTTTVNRRIKENHAPAGSAHVQKVSVKGKIGHLRITVSNPGRNTRFFGVGMDNESSGVVVDNFSLRGVSGETLKSIPAQILCDFDSIRHYDLVVLQYGLNVATKNGKDYGYYRKVMKNAIAHLKENMPNSDFLLLSVGDRATNINGTMTTMGGVKNLATVQQNIASDCGIAYLNMIEIMALDGGIAAYVKAKPSKANRDYTHINMRGGVLMAQRLFDTFEYGKQRYAEKKKFNGQQ